MTNKKHLSLNFIDGYLKYDPNNIIILWNLSDQNFKYTGQNAKKMILKSFHG
jgi:hypothetical protein